MLQTLTIPSFQLCHSKKLSNFPRNPVPAIYCLSPMNPKALDIAFPHMPNPPPFTPENHYQSRLIYFESNFCKLGGEKGKKVKSEGRMRTMTSVSSKRSNFLKDQDEEGESLIFGLSSFSDEFYQEGVHEREISRRVISSTKKVLRQRFQRLEMTKKRTMTSLVGSMTQCMVEGKVKESFAVVKSSKDLYKDFKKSMLEMIMEMEMFEAK